MTLAINYSRKALQYGLVLALIFTLFLGSNIGVAKAASLEVSGWIPYWRDSEGMRDATKHIKQIDTVFPFAYIAQSDGSIKDMAGLSDSDWKKFIKNARAKNVEIIPSIMWSDGASIHAVLSNEVSRKQHIEVIVAMVKKGKYDGVDIDYEAKRAETKDYYSLFLKELKAALGKSKLLTCTVEARTPPDSLYKVVPSNIEYANDYKAIAQHCDRIELMAYDQQRADIKLNEERTGMPYMPVADIDWVRKVVELALKDFPKEKVILGIPTYGHHYQVTVSPNWFRDYKKIGALNIPDILDVADDYDVEPGRNKAGEMSYSYFPESSVYKILRSLPVPEGTPKGMEAAAQALLFANMANHTLTFNIAWYSDAEAVEDKIALAKEYDLRGVALFKIDGEEDQDIWKLLK